MDSSTKNALFIVGVVLATIVVAFVSFLIGSMIFESKNSVEDTSIKIAFYAEEDAEDIYTFDAKLGDQIVLPTAEECEFEAEEGYELKCWALEGEETTYQPGERVIFTESVNFYAVWEEKQEGPEDPNPGNPDNPTPEDPTPGNPEDPTNPDNPTPQQIMFYTMVNSIDSQMLGSFSVEIGESITLPTIESFNFSREGYRFVGWRNIDINNINNILYPGDAFIVTERTTFWSVWEEVEEPNPDNPAFDQDVTAFFYTSSTKVNVIPTPPPLLLGQMSVKAGQSFVLPTIESFDCDVEGYERDGYTFLGWRDIGENVNNTLQPGESVAILGDMNFHAVWQKGEDPEDPEPTIYTVELYADDSLDELLESYEVEEGEYFTLPTIESLGYEKEGYQFVSWSGYDPYDEVLINSDRTFYAEWEEVEEPEPEEPEDPEEPTTPEDPEPTIYTVELYADYEDEIPLASYEVEEGEYFTLPSIESLGYEKEGYQFVSWSGYDPYDEILINTDRTFYAEWEEMKYVGPEYYFDEYGAVYCFDDETETYSLIDIGDVAVDSYTVLDEINGFVVDSIGKAQSFDIINTNLKSFTLGENITTDEINIYLPKLEELNYNCVNLRTKVSYLGIFLANLPFSGCGQESENGLVINIGTSVEEIPDYTFAYVYNIKEINFVDIENSKCESIGSRAFFIYGGLGTEVYNELITELSFPKKLTSIGLEAFYHMPNISTINYYAENCKSIDLYSNIGINGITLKVYSGVRLLNAFIPYLKSIEYVGEVTLEDLTLEYCTELQNLTLPESLKLITLKDCSKLENILIETNSLEGHDHDKNSWQVFAKINSDVDVNVTISENVTDIIYSEDYNAICFDGIKSIKFLGRTKCVYRDLPRPIYVKERDIGWYCDEWYLSTERYYYTTEEEWDENLGQYKEIQVQHEDSNWYGRRGISIY